MSGGGALGSYEAGALWGMYYNAADKSQYQYDVSTGVSAGALNTAAVSLFAPGDEDNMLDFLSNNWQGIDNDSVFKMWEPLGLVTGVTSKSGVLDDSPLFEFITQVYEDHDYEIKRKIAVSCVDVNTGDYVVFDETEPEIVKAVVSSASIPFAFPNQQWPDKKVVCMDGGTVWNTNLVSAVERCREQVDSDDQITLDIVTCGTPHLAKWEDKDKALANYLRYMQIKSYNNGLDDVNEFIQAYPEVNFRHYVTPSESLGSGLAILNFDNATSTYPMQMVGRKDGENAVK
mmetsp:Transcript_26513/g.40485  ORF Transcript_26513/g.40485 Transcript_26513/m.40485 type:complete len:288 (-) Transcript_26513:187-1050(-)